MLRVAAGELPETLRIARPGSIVAFGKRDVVDAGYPSAVRSARDGGFEAIERLAGGRAAVFHHDTIAFAHAVREPDPRGGITRRFDATAALAAGALSRFGIDARVGEVAGEYCPGEHSVSVGGVRKLMGVGQRLVAGGVHVGGVIVVGGADRVRDVLVPVYEALSLDWRPETTGSVADEAPGTSWDDVVQALLSEYGNRYELEPVQLDVETLDLARRLAPEHFSPVTTTPRAPSSRGRSSPSA
jgi:lipoate-protein ligase A